MRGDLWLAVALSLAACGTPATADDERAKKREQSTREGIRELLSTAWDAPSGKVKQVGSSILNRYQRRDADPASLQYAYGLVLARHGEWAPAEANFRKASDKLKDIAEADLALCHVHLRAGRFSQALDDLRRAWESGAERNAVIETIAVLTTFLQESPPSRFRPEEARALADEVFPTLSDEQQTVYRGARDQTLQYIKSLPALREELLEPVEALRTTAEKLQKQARDVEIDLRKKEAEANRRQAQIERIAASAMVDAARLDRLIQNALGRGDTARAQAYQAEKLAMLQNAQAQADVERARLNETQLEVRRLQDDLSGLLGEAEQLIDEIVQSESAIEAQLSMPPPLWDPSSERERLLQSGWVGKRAGPVPRKVASNPRTDADRARSLLQIADSLRSSGLPALAQKYFERIVEEFPNTPAGKDAAWELEQMKESKSAPPTSRKPRDRSSK